jgi:glutaredoxin
MRHPSWTLLLLVVACTHKSAPQASTEIDAGRAPTEPVIISVTDGRTDLIFSYQDEQGRFHDTQKIGEVPESARKHVLVRDLSLKPEEVHADEFLYVADLTDREDGGYPYALVSRYHFHLPDPGEEGGELEDGGQAEGPVIVYGTSWCGACAQARKYLSAKNIPFLDKDIEKDEAAAQALARKMKRAGVNYRGVPVIDVKGHLMEGFDPRAVEQALHAG